MIPEMRAEPGAAGGPEAPERAVDGAVARQSIGVVMTNPTVRSVVYPRRAAAVFDKLCSHPQQRLMALGKISHLGGPVVHLGVDIDRVFGSQGGVIDSFQMP